MNATTMEIDLEALGGASAAPDAPLARHRHFEQIPHTVERGILVFVILATLLGNYATHSHLMRDLLIS